jgi:hypothetical protein
MCCRVIYQCRSSQLAQQACYTPNGTHLTANPTTFMPTKKGHLTPGQIVAIDHYMQSTCQVWLEDKYKGGILFVNHASGFFYIQN